MGDLAPIAPQLGVFTALVIVIGYLLNGMRKDRGQYEEAIDNAERRADAADQRRRDAEADRDRALAEKRTADDQAAAVLREVHGLREQVERLTAEVVRLRTRLGVIT